MKVTLKKSIMKTVTRKEVPNGQVNELVQTNLDKGVIDSEQQAPVSFIQICKQLKKRQ